MQVIEATLPTLEALAWPDTPAWMASSFTARADIAVLTNVRLGMVDMASCAKDCSAWLITAAHSRRYRQLTNQLGKDLAPLGIRGALLALDG